VITRAFHPHSITPPSIIITKTTTHSCGAMSKLDQIPAAAAVENAFK
jgi:hypothetical protein